MKMKKLTLKGQIGSMIIALGIAAITLLLILVVFSNVSRNVDDNIIKDDGSVLNESFTPSDNVYVTLANAQGTCTIIEVWNTTNDIPVGSGNWTQDNCALNVTCDYGELCFVNSTAFVVSYDYENNTAYHTALGDVRSTGLNSINLGSVGLIVLAAVAILGIVLSFGK